MPQTGGSHYEITAIGAYDGKLYIAVKTNALLGGLYVYDFLTDAITWIGTFEIVGGSDINTFYKATNGQIYAGSGTGFFKRIADNNWTRIGGGWCRSIAENSQGLLYYTTFDSLYVYDGVTKRGLKSGLFYSCAVDDNDIVYASNASDVFKYENNTFTALGFGGYSKSMAKDLNGKVWIASASTTTSFGLKVIDNGSITTYNSGNSPLSSTDMTAIYVGNDNKKWIGHYSAGLNTIVDAAVVLPITISPGLVNTQMGAVVKFKAGYGTKPYQWSVSPANLGVFLTSGDSATFKANVAGTGTIIVKSANGLDSALASISIADTTVIIKLPPTGLTVTKGKFQDRIDASWVVPGEFDQAFEDGIPEGWRVVPPVGQQTLWVESGFQPHGGAKCIKYDVYSPGSPATDWLITEKVHISLEKSNLTFYLRTAYAFGNPYSSFVKVSTTTSDTSAFTSTVKVLDPQYLADSNLIWRPVSIDLSSYINQDIYIAFQAKAEDIIIYLDDVKMSGQPGLTATGRAVKSYRLYRSTTPQNIQSQGNLVLDQLVTTFSSTNVPPLTNYYYAVSAVYDSNYETEITPVNFGIAYQQGDSIVLNPVSSVVPVIDGIVNDTEYGDAQQITLTRNGYWGAVYAKVAGSKLYLGYDLFGDSTLSNDDYVLFAFDKNRDYTYQDSLEGYYRVRKDGSGVELAYFPFVTPFGFNQGFINPVGFEGGASLNAGSVQFEMAIDLLSSKLNLPPNGKIGGFLSAFDANKFRESSWLEKLLAKEYSILGFGSLNIPIPSSVEKHEIIPVEFALSQNYPNPFNPSTVINYSIAKAGVFSLKLYDITGKEISVLFSESKQVGNYNVKFDASKLASGIYFYELSGENVKISRKMTLVK
ncbi:MAG: T9SS type A sorting domain-containing protein [Ignavibacteriales bacterium]|nr:T9SS type A sorting domain-containing protein [Ignavibacteriales bacterium]